MTSYNHLNLLWSLLLYSLRITTKTNTISEADMSVQNDYIQTQSYRKYEYKSRQGKTLNLIKVIILESILVWISKQEYEIIILNI